MSDTSPKNQNALTAGHVAAKPVAVAKPRARVFYFVRETDHVRFLCELLDHGLYGVEAQIFRNEEFFHSRTFPSDGLARVWADAQRTALETDDPI